MNDVMSAGMHRLWKDHFVKMLGVSNIRESIDENVGSTFNHLDVAGGTGDISFRVCEELRIRDMAGVPTNTVINKHPLSVTICDINPDMLLEGEKRAVDLYGTSIVATREELKSNPMSTKPVHFVLGNAEHLPQFEDNSFDLYTISFGLRNVTTPENAIKEAYRVLKPGGRLAILEFSIPTNPIIKQLYETYSFNVIPKMGEIVADDRESYQYLVESIRKFDDQETLKERITRCGFEGSKYTNFNNGVVAVHEGWKL